MTNFKRLMQGVALGALVVAGNAHGQTISTAVVSTGTTTPLSTAPVSTAPVVAPSYGNIDPFYKDIVAFAGEAPPNYALVGTFWKDFGATWTLADQQWGTVGS